MSNRDMTLPPRWVVATISDVSQYFRGVSYQKSDAVSSPAEGCIPILRANNLGDGFDLRDLVYVPSDCVSKAQMVCANDIVLAMSIVLSEPGPDRLRTLIVVGLRKARRWHKAAPPRVLEIGLPIAAVGVANIGQVALANHLRPCHTNFSPRREWLVPALMVPMRWDEDAAWAATYGAPEVLSHFG